jgi:DNA-binding PucR family transcriptional regulator
MDDEFWEAQTNKGYMDSQMVQLRDFQDYLTQLEEGKLLHNLPIHDNKYLSAYPLLINHKVVGSANLLQKNHPVSVGDAACLKFFAEMVSMLLLKTQAFKYHALSLYASLFTELLEGTLEDPEKIDLRRRLLFWDIGDSISLVTIQPRSGYRTDSQLDALLDDISSVIPHESSIVYQGGIVTLLDNSKIEEAQGRDIASILETTLLERDFVAGVSDVGTSLADVRSLYQQTLCALRIRERVAPRITLCFYRDYRRFAVYDACLQQGTQDDYLHPCLRELEEYDKRKKSALRGTLECLVRNHGNQVKAAKELFIQRNTLLYRIKKIEQICAVDLRDPDVLFQIQFSFGLKCYAQARTGA